MLELKKTSEVNYFTPSYFFDKETGLKRRNLCAEGHTASKWQNSDSNPGLWIPNLLPGHTAIRQEEFILVPHISPSRNFVCYPPGKHIKRTVKEGASSLLSTMGSK